MEVIVTDKINTALICAKVEYVREGLLCYQIDSDIRSFGFLDHWYVDSKKAEESMLSTLESRQDFLVNRMAMINAELSAVIKEIQVVKIYLTGKG